MKKDGRSGNARHWHVGAVGLLMMLACMPARADLVILPTYDGTVSAAAQTAFNTVVSLFEATYSGTANMTVGIDVTFNGGCTGGCLGQSTTTLVAYSYSQWYNAMGADAAANPGNTYLAAGYASLPATNPYANAGNPSDYVGMTYANAQALGLESGSYFMDSTIAFNPSQTFEYTGTATAGDYDFMNTAEHELDEALGIGSGLNPGFPFPGANMAEDYFRYASNGVRGSSTDSTQSVYFSYDGGLTNVQTFNTVSGGDFNDWAQECGTPHVQDAFTCSGVASTYDSNSPEFAVMSTLGYDGTAPEPGTWALMGGALGGLALLRRRVAR